ncbi:hypothetical protein GCM10027419_47410 [Pandoraea terrae]
MLAGCHRQDRVVREALAELLLCAPGEFDIDMLLRAGMERRLARRLIPLLQVAPPGALAREIIEIPTAADWIDAMDETESGDPAGVDFFTLCTLQLFGRDVLSDPVVRQAIDRSCMALAPLPAGGDLHARARARQLLAPVIALAPDSQRLTMHSGEPPLLYVTRMNGSEADVRWLLAHCLPPNVASPNCTALPNHRGPTYSVPGASPLHYAARHGNVPVIRALLAAGADLHARDSGGRTPLLSFGDREGVPRPCDRDPAHLDHCLDTVGCLMTAGADVRDIGGTRETLVIVMLIACFNAGGGSAGAYDRLVHWLVDLHMRGFPFRSGEGEPAIDPIWALDKLAAREGGEFLRYRTLRELLTSFTR